MLYSCKVVSFMDKLEQDERLTQSFSELKHCGNNYHAREATKKLPDISRFNADNGTQSAKCHCIIDWNRFFKKITVHLQKGYTYEKIKSTHKKYYLDNSLHKK